MYRLEEATKDEVVKWTWDIVNAIKGNPHLNVTISLWKPKKTQSQLGLLFRAIEFFIKARDGFVTNFVDESEKKMIAQGLVDAYGNKKPSGLIIDNEQGEVIEQLIPIPLSEINRFEDFDVIFNGLFFVEAPYCGVDMSGFIKEWDQYKKEERGKRNAKGTV